MKAVWENVRADGSVVVGEERLPGKDTLLDEFERAISAGGWRFVSWESRRSAPFQCIVERDGHRIDVVLYLKKISNAGWDWRPQCKRVQVSNIRKFEHLFLRRESAQKINLIIGLYDYEAPLFAAWDASQYVGHETNRSCYIDSEQLIQGYRSGYTETECAGLPVTVFRPEHLTKYLERYIDALVPTRPGYVVNRDRMRAVGARAAELLANDASMARYWDGRAVVTEMRDRRSRNWKQTEWPGWYFEELAVSVLTAVDNGFVPAECRYGSSTIDLFQLIPWDLKAHAAGERGEIPANSTEAIDGAIEDYGYIGFIILEGEPIRDDDGAFREWHESLKGSRSKYSLEREARGAAPRARKKAFIPQRIRVIVIDARARDRLASFQKGMRNSDGSPRTEKKSIRVSSLPASCVIADETIHVIDI